MVAADTFVVAVPCMGAADPAANVAAFRADVPMSAIKLTAWVTNILVVDLDVDSFVVAVPADGKLQTILSGVVNKSSLVEMTDIIGILFFFVVLIIIIKVVVFFRLGVVIGRVKVIVFNFGVVVVIRGIGGFDV